MQLQILTPTAISDTWTPIVLPNNVRHSVGFQLESLKTFYWSLDGVTGMAAVGTGEELLGNFSKKTLYFKTTSGVDNIIIKIQDSVERSV